MEEVTKKEITTVHQEPAKVVETTTKTVPPAVKTEHPQQVYEKKKVIFRAYQIIWYVLLVVEVLLIFRITLKALGANPMSGFVNLIYSITDPLVAPFQGMFQVSASATGAVFEWSTIIAAVVYALIAIGLVHLFQLIRPVSPHEVNDIVDNS